jgi:S1-C subfamily serine protease
MRMTFGLVSLLVVLAVVMYLFKTVDAPEIEGAKKAQDQAQQISGRDANGVAAMSSYKAEEFDVGNQLRGIKITDVTAGGPMDQFYGLKVGDVVLQIGGLDAASLGDYGSAKGQLDQAFQESKSLLVDRGGTQMTLPVGGAKSPLDNLNIPTH